MDDLTIKAGVKTGGGREPVLGGNLPPDPTASALKTLESFAKLGASVVAPIIEKEKTAAWVRGVTEVMQGRTTEQLAKEQPSWARMFGDDYAVQGARMQEAASHGTRFLTGLQERMPELRKLNQEQFSRHVAETLDVGLPKDPQAAMLAKQRVLQALPEMTGQWSRAHAQWQQEDALVRHTEFLQSEFQLMKSGEEARRLNPAVIDPSMDEQARARFQTARIAPPGVNPKTHAELLNKLTVQAVGSKGGIGFWQYLSESGEFEQLDQGVQDQVLTQLGQTVRRELQPAYKAAAEKRLPQAWAEVRNQAATEPDPAAFLAAAAKGLNESFAAATGLPQQLHEFISPQQLEGAMVAAGAQRDRMLAALERRQEAAERRQEAARLRALLRPDHAMQTSMAANIILGTQGPGEAGAAIAANTQIQAKAAGEAMTQLFQQASFGTAPEGSPEFLQAARDRAAVVTNMQMPGRTIPSPVIRNALIQPLLNPSNPRQAAEAITTLSLMPESTRTGLLGAQGSKLYAAFARELAASRQVDTKTGAVTYTTPIAELHQRARLHAATPSLVPQGGEKGAVRSAEFAKGAGLSGPQGEIYGAIVNNVYQTLDHLPEEERLRDSPAYASQQVLKVGKWAVLNHLDGADYRQVTPTTQLGAQALGKALDLALGAGRVPASARVHAVAARSGSLVFRAEWTDAQGRRQQYSVHGASLVEQERVRPVPGAPTEPPEPMPEQLSQQ